MPFTLLSRLVVAVSVLLLTSTAFAEVPVETGIIDAFATLKMSTYVFTLLAALTGAGVYTYRHKKILKFDKLFGLATALVLTIILYQISASQILDDTSKVCWVITDASDELISPCAQGRENLANLIGLKSLYTTISPRQMLETGIAEPIGPIAIKFMIYVSLLLSSLGLCALFQWLSKKFFIYR